MVEGKCTNGYKFKVDPNVIKDYRFLDAVSLELSDNEFDRIKGTTQEINLVLGDKKQALLDYIAKKHNGFIPSEEVNKCVAEMITAMKEADSDIKKSTP